MGSKSQTTTSTAAPWAPAQPYLLDTMRQAQNLYDNGNGMVAPFSPQTRQYFDRATAYANSNPLGGASNMMNSTINGDYMSPGTNPYLDATYKHAAGLLGDQVNSMFSMAGRYGSGADQQTLGNSLGNLANSMYSQNYQNERQNQLNAATFMPQMSNANMANLGIIGNVGNQIENKQQAFMAQPYNLLSQFYSPIVNGTAGLGQQGSQTTPTGNGISGALGGAAAGAQMGSMFGPWGTGIGAGVGLLGGLF